MGETWERDLARLEEAQQTLRDKAVPDLPGVNDLLAINPSLILLELEWRNLCTQLRNKAKGEVPEPGRELVLLYRQPGTGEICFHPARDHQLLALKVLAEDLDRQAVADEAGVVVGRVDAAIEKAAKDGVLLRPPSKIVRTSAHYPDAGIGGFEPYLRADYFTLQWHVTQACDLHCKHCYDRSTISPLTLEQGIVILDQFRDFVLEENVHGQVTFTGGNPLLYAHFEELYREAADRNLNIAILGNPASREIIESLQQIQPLSYYQVSLEGMQEHNDSIRGEGHFQRVMEFLQVLEDLSVYSMVMLTLTRENMGQVLELAEVLRDKVKLFTFNRLSFLLPVWQTVIDPIPDSLRSFCLVKIYTTTTDLVFYGLLSFTYRTLR